DPYLEDDALWPDFHRHLIRCLHQAILPNLVDRYRARLDQRCYVSDRARCEQYVEVVESGNGRLVTLLDVVSPANKVSGEGRAAYLARRQEAKAAGATTVEIDLILQGRPTLDYSRDGLPDWDYAVTVTRCTQP